MSLVAFAIPGHYRKVSFGDSGSPYGVVGLLHSITVVFVLLFNEDVGYTYHKRIKFFCLIMWFVASIALFVFGHRYYIIIPPSGSVIQKMIGCVSVSALLLLISILR